MSKNVFFKSKGPFKLNILFPNQSDTKTNVKDIKTLDNAEKLDLTFFDSLNYKDLAEKTSKKISGCALSINKNASPDKRSYKVDFSKYDNLAKDYRCTISLDEAIDGLVFGLKNCADLAKNFRETDYMRLNCLNNLINMSVIDNNLNLKI